jgi:hypothetical protein
MVPDKRSRGQSKIRRGERQNHQGPQKCSNADSTLKPRRSLDFCMAETVAQLGKHNDKQGVADALEEEDNQVGISVGLFKAFDDGFPF